MTTRNILLATAAISLLMTGCAQKKSVMAGTTTSGEFDNGSNLGGATTGVYEEVQGYEDNTGHYDNVDPYGNGNYGANSGNGYGNGNGINGYNGQDNGKYTNGGYANGSYDNGDYGNEVGGIQNVYFGVDQYAITSEKLSIISHNASLIKDDIRNGARLKIEGHCDATGSDEYNYALGLRRAKAAKDAMVSNGINSEKISLVSMGESSPACTSSTSAECYAKNRRVEFQIIQ